MRTNTITATVTSEGELAFASLSYWRSILRKFRGVAVRVTVAPIPEPRSTEQNSLYWVSRVPAFSEWSGYEEREAHEILKAMFLRVEVTLPTGKRAERVRSTTDLTVEEFSEYLDQIDRFLALQGVACE